MRRLAIAALVLALAVPAPAAFGQTMNARRTAMGGVVLPSGGPGNDAGNVAYRALPVAPGSSSNLALPIGLIPLLANPPALDPGDPDFNIYELANTLYNPPFNLQLSEPEAPSTDIVVAIGKNHLAVELGEVSRLFPEDHSRFGASGSLPSLAFGYRAFFGAATVAAHYQNELSMNPDLHAVLADGAPFQPNTEYALYDNAAGQAMMSLQLGWAGALKRVGQPRITGGNGFYGGVRAKILRGLAYGDAQNVVSFATPDTLFSNAAIDLGYTGMIRQAGPSGGGWGHALDVGLVWACDAFEVGLGINDVVSRVNWRVEESLAYRDRTNQELVRRILAEDVSYQSELPKRGTVNAVARLASTVVAADVVRSMGSTTAHVGLERWQGPLALRTGGSLDPNRRLQFSGGAGLKLGRFGLDLAVATHNRNMAHERGVELAAGLALYH